MWNLRGYIIHTYLTESQLITPETKTESPLIEKSMLLQITRKHGRIHVSDGENFAYLNVRRERETMVKLCDKINQSASIEDLNCSLFLFNNFHFKYDWDYQNQELVISIECDDFECVAPRNYLEKHKRDKYIGLTLGTMEKEKYKRLAMEKSLEASNVYKSGGNFSNLEIGFDDIMAVESKQNDEGLLVMSELMSSGRKKDNKDIVKKAKKTVEKEENDGKNMFTSDDLKEFDRIDAEENAKKMVEEKIDEDDKDNIIIEFEQNKNDTFLVNAGSFGEIEMKKKNKKKAEKENERNFAKDVKILEGWIELPESTGLVRRGKNFENLDELFKKYKIPKFKEFDKIKPHYNHNLPNYKIDDTFSDIDSSDCEITGSKKKKQNLKKNVSNSNSAKKCEKLLKKGKETLKKEKKILEGLESDKIMSNLELKIDNDTRRAPSEKKPKLKRGKSNDDSEEIELEDDFNLSEKRKIPTSVRKYKTRRAKKINIDED